MATSAQRKVIKNKLRLQAHLEAYRWLPLYKEGTAEIFAYVVSKSAWDRVVMNLYGIDVSDNILTNIGSGERRIADLIPGHTGINYKFHNFVKIGNQVTTYIKDSILFEPNEHIAWYPNLQGTPRHEYMNDPVIKRVRLSLARKA